MLLLFYCLVVASGSKTLRVTVEEGILEGEVLVPSTKKGTYCSFKGIPYARPPLGELRFQEPQPPLKWKDVRKATQHGPVCIQQSAPLSALILGSEDCLYLNVYTPNINPPEPIPVMFYIHGGYFVSGSGNDYFFSPDFLVGYGVILVTINYRLDALGFLSVDTERALGNAGLKDQVAALKWVQRNIRNFGGDPSNVTIFGQSAGGSSVSLHMISPAARGLFNRAVPMSGVMFNPFSFNVAHVERAFNIGKRLRCYTDDSDELIDCFLNIPAEKFLYVRPNILLSDEVYNSVLSNIYFGPVVEKKYCENQYLTEQPSDLVCKGIFNDVDLMIGYAENEGLYATTLCQSSILENYPLYKELYLPVAISYLKSPKQVLDLGNMIENAYFGNKTVTLNTIRTFVQYYTWSHYNFDIHYFLDYIVPKRSAKKRFFYIFSIYSSRNAYSKEGANQYGIHQATHLDDLPYLFDGRGFNLTLDLTSEAYQYVEKMCRLYINFAKYGTPTPDNSFGVIWPNYSDNMKYIRLDKILTIETVIYAGQLEYWRNIYKEEGVEPYLG